MEEQPQNPQEPIQGPEPIPGAVGVPLPIPEMGQPDDPSDEEE